MLRHHGQHDLTITSIDAHARHKIAQYPPAKLKASEVNLNAKITATEEDMTGIDDIEVYDY